MRNSRFACRDGNCATPRTLGAAWDETLSSETRVLKALALSGRYRRFAGDRRGGVLVAIDRRDQVLAQSERCVDLLLDLLRHRRVRVEVGLGVPAPLAETVVAVGEERAGLGDDVVLQPEVDQAARGGDALAELDVELGLAEGGRDLVLDDLHAHAVADRLRAVLERLDPPDVQTLGGVELQRATAWLGLRRAEHDADLFADLVGEDAERLRTIEV